jgi:hypothetical protein
VKQAVTNFEKVGAREMLQEHATQDVRPDAKEVEQRYREAVRELKVRSVLFSRQTDANAFHAAVKGGGDFPALVKKAVADKKAKGDEEAHFVRLSSMLPQTAVKVVKLKPGEITPVMKLKEGFAIARVEDVRYPEGDAAARAEAEKQSLLRQKKIALQKYSDGLVKRYATIDDALLKRLDLQAKKPGIDALEKDKRIVARIQARSRSRSARSRRTSGSSSSTASIARSRRRRSTRRSTRPSTRSCPIASCRSRRAGSGSWTAPSTRGGSRRRRRVRSSRRS